MQNPIQDRETLSAYMDGHHASGTFAEKLCKTDELQQKWANYHLIRSVMRGEEQLLGQDFSAQMEALLENEQIEKAPKGLLLKLKSWKNTALQAGIAASVCLATVLGVNSFNQSAEVAKTEPVLQTTPFSNAIQPVSYNAPSQTQPTAEQLEYQQQRINALLQNYELQRRTGVEGVSLSEQEKQQSQSSSTEPKK